LDQHVAADGARDASGGCEFRKYLHKADPIHYVPEGTDFDLSFSQPSSRWWSACLLAPHDRERIPCPDAAVPAIHLKLDRCHTLFLRECKPWNAEITSPGLLSGNVRPASAQNNF
jgi:hypothetical protein